jgi:hypothetical protein
MNKYQEELKNNTEVGKKRFDFFMDLIVNIALDENLSRQDTKEILKQIVEEL